MGWTPVGRWRLAAVVLGVVFALAAGTTGYVATQPAYDLTVSDADTGEVLLSTPVSDGDNITLAYTHSVEKTPIEDVYRVNGTQLDNTLMRFQSYGWGLPARENVTLAGGWFVFDPDRSYDAFYVTPGRIAGHTLRVDGRSYDLVALSNASSVRISVDHHSLLERVPWR